MLSKSGTETKLLVLNNQRVLSGKVALNTRSNFKTQFQRVSSPARLFKQKVERSSFLQRLSYCSDSAQGESHPSPVTERSWGGQLNSGSWVPKYGKGVSPLKDRFPANCQTERNRTYAFLEVPDNSERNKACSVQQELNFHLNPNERLLCGFLALFKGKESPIQTDVSETVISGTKWSHQLLYLSRAIISSSVVALSREI